MNIGAESDGGENRLLKTHRASTWTARLLQRGLTVIQPGDSGLTDMWCCLNCIILSVHSFSWTRLKKIHVNASFCYSFFFFSTVQMLVCGSVCTNEYSFQGHKCSLFGCTTIRDRVSDAKCLEVRQIYGGEWTVSEDLEQIHKDWIWLFGSVSLPHIWAQTRQCSLWQRSVMSWVVAQLKVISHEFPLPAHTHKHPWFDFCLVLCAPPGFVCIPLALCKCYGLFWQCSCLCAVHARSGQAQTQPFGVKVCRVSSERDLPVTNVLQLTHFWLPEGVGGVHRMWKKKKVLFTTLSARPHVMCGLIIHLSFLQSMLS